MKNNFIKIVFLSTAITSLAGCGNFQDVIDDGLSVVNSVTDVGLSIVNSVVDNPGQTWSDIVQFADNVWTDTLPIVEQNWSSISTWGEATWTNVVDWSSTQGEAVANWTTKTIDGVKVTVAEVGNYIISVKEGVVAFGLKKGIDKLDLLKAPLQEDGWQEYVGDPETLVYSLINNQLAKAYEVFPAKVISPLTGDEVYGIGFTDKQSAFVSNAGGLNEVLYFSTGFISIINEFHLSPEEYETGLEIIRIDDTDSSQFRYFYAYNIKPFDTHVVIDNKYIQYGVDKNHQVYFDLSDVNGNYNQMLGSLYSYDQDVFIFGTDNGLVPTIENTVSDLFDFESWSSAINENLKSGTSFSFDSLKYIVSKGLNSVKTIINNLNEQTILGYSISDLKNQVNGVKEDDIAIVNDSKVAMHSVSSTIPSDIVKWLIGMSTLIYFIGTIQIAKSFPRLLPFAPAIIGAAIQVFVETVFENHHITEINWIKVALAALAGAISSQLGPIGDAFVGGITNTIFSLLDGGTFLDASLSFVSGFAIGLAMAGIFKVLSVGITAVRAKLSDVFTDRIGSYIARNIASIDGNTASKVFVNATDSVNVNSSVTSSVNDAAQSFNNNNLSYLTKKAIRQLPSDNSIYFRKVDANGKTLTKIDLFKNGGNGYLVLNDIPNNKYKFLFKDKFGNSIEQLPIINGYPSFDGISKVKVKLDDGIFLSPNRQQNFAKADQKVIDLLRKNDPSVQEFKNYFINKGISLDNLSLKNIKDMRSELGLIWHEVEDGVSFQLVDGLIHQAISHSGGFSIAKFAAANKIPMQLLLNRAN